MSDMFNNAGHRRARVAPVLREQTRIARLEAEAAEDEEERALTERPNKLLVAVEACFVDLRLVRASGGARRSARTIRRWLAW